MKLSPWLNGLCLLLLLVFTGCGPRVTPSAPAPKALSEHFPVKVGDITVQMQLALSPNEMERGLMGRQRLENDEGMLFVFVHPQQMTFWMHDTPSPLDIGFFDSEGVLREVYAMQPYDENTTASRDHYLQLALEMNQGWFHDRGIKPGAKMDLQTVKAGMVARGFEPAHFGLR